MGVTSVALQAVTMMAASRANATNIIALRTAAAAEQQVVQLIEAASGRGSLVNLLA